MRTYMHAQTVPPGVYLATKPLDLTIVTDDADVLEGLDGARYVRLPAPVVFLVSPVVGGAFVLLFPVIIFAAFAWAAWTYGARRIGEVLERHAHLAATPGLPVMSYLKRRADEELDDVEDARLERDGDDELEGLRDEVAARRRAERGGDER